jgi:hypothetical protein
MNLASGAPPLHAAPLLPRLPFLLRVLSCSPCAGPALTCAASPGGLLQPLSTKEQAQLVGPIKELDLVLTQVLPHPPLPLPLPPAALFPRLLQLDCVLTDAGCVLFSGLLGVGLMRGWCCVCGLQLAAGLPVDVMPGASDPANYSLPQQVIRGWGSPRGPCVDALRLLAPLSR